jgi:hypothetical protein
MSTTGSYLSAIEWQSNHVNNRVNVNLIVSHLQTTCSLYCFFGVTKNIKCVCYLVTNTILLRLICFQHKKSHDMQHFCLRAAYFE